MMSPIEILDRAAELHLDVHLTDDAAHIWVPNQIPSELDQEIVSERDAVLRELARREYRQLVHELDQLRQEIDFRSQPYGERLTLCAEAFDVKLDRLGLLVKILGLSEESRLLAERDTETSHVEDPVTFVVN